ncbi:late competence protein ComER [Thalassobacillus pellis]|uniref:late competence protein ComER n=1 Tax=Thalassobacillus pellis TaxID=748008 RepID=UPI00195F9126|nr:late competence protein ComER [Thalassobacillus pellis]MBM7554700.1 competence protein ComER [Thalassobacillus pellis]
MNWGVIGTGNMGTILIESLLDSGALDSEDLTITNRSLEKAYNLKKKYSGLNIEKDIIKVAEQSDIVFICVKPHDMKPLFKELAASLSKDQCVVSITSPVDVNELEQCLPCQVARIVPSITNRAFQGASLITFGQNVTPTTKALLKQTFKFISKPIETEEQYIRVCSDIVSCGPAFLSFLMEKWIIAAGEVAGLPDDTATDLTCEMLIGYGELLSKEHYTLQKLREKVSVKGGVTGEGIQALEANIGELFERMFEATQAKHRQDKQMLRRMD